MKFSFNIHWFSAVALAAAFVSCAQIDDSREDAVGYLCFPGVEVDVTVEDLAGTKSLDGFAAVWPGESEIDFVITGVTDPAYSKTFSGVDAWATTPIALPAGSYKVTASVNTNSFGKPYFTSNEVLVSIDALKQTTPSAMNFSVANAAVNVTVHSSLAGHFKPAADRDSWTSADDVTLVSNGVTYTAKYDTPCFVPAGQELTVTLNGVSSAGVSKSYSDSFTPSAKSSYNVVCGQENNNLPTISLLDQQAGACAGRLYIDPATISGNITDDNKAKLVYEVIPEGGDWNNALTAEQISGDYYVIKGLTNGSRYTVRARIGNLVSAEKTVTVKENLEGVTVKSEHYKDGNGDLAGTNSTLSVALPGILGTLNSPEVGLLQITGYSLSNGSETVRTASSAGVMTAASSWPYLPQGSNYVLTIDHKLSNETATVASKNTGVTSPSPRDFISIKLTSYSSYDKYLENNKDAANAMDAFTIKTLGATWTVASALMNNTNYSKSFTYNNNGLSVSTFTGNTCSLGDKGSLAVGTQYKVSASLTFDGEKVETGTKTHYITGLPYIGDFSNTNKDINWNVTQDSRCEVTFSTNSVKLLATRYGLFGSTVHAKIASKQSFILPSAVNVNFVNVASASGNLPTYALRFGTDVKTSTSSVNINENHERGAGTYQVELDVYYGSTTTYYFTVSDLKIQYGPLK